MTREQKTVYRRRFHIKAGAWNDFCTLLVCIDRALISMNGRVERESIYRGITRLGRVYKQCIRRQGYTTHVMSKHRGRKKLQHARRHEEAHIIGVEPIELSHLWSTIIDEEESFIEYSGSDVELLESTNSGSQSEWLPPGAL